jgi:protein-S-isoprenylcysteine O-methyltransferase Ste14
MNLEQISYYVNAISFGLLIVLWFTFAWAFFLRERPTSAPDAKRVPLSWLGLGLQGAGFGIVWTIRRSPFASPMFEGGFAVNIASQIVGILMATASVWLAIASIKELGRHWSLAARLTEDHKLITLGVYSLVLHPIYTAMFGMLIATGIVFSQWTALIAAIVVFFVGTKIRTRLEEDLLRDAVGEEFTAWEAKVPGLIPFVKI